MRASPLLLVVIAAVISQPAIAAGKRPRDAVAAVPSTDVAPPYKTDRLSSSRGEPILNTPGQTTVLTRQVLDDIRRPVCGMPCARPPG